MLAVSPNQVLQLAVVPQGQVDPLPPLSPPPG